MTEPLKNMNTCRAWCFYFVLLTLLIVPLSLVSKHYACETAHEKYRTWSVWPDLTVDLGWLSVLFFGRILIAWQKYKFYQTLMYRLRVAQFELGTISHRSTIRQFQALCSLLLSDNKLYSKPITTDMFPKKLSTFDTSRCNIIFLDIKSGSVLKINLTGEGASHWIGPLQMQIFTT